MHYFRLDLVSNTFVRSFNACWTAQLLLSGHLLLKLPSLDFARRVWYTVKRVSLECPRNISEYNKFSVMSGRWCWTCGIWCGHHKFLSIQRSEFRRRGAALKLCICRILCKHLGSSSVYLHVRQSFPKFHYTNIFTIESIQADGGVLYNFWSILLNEYLTDSI